MYYFLRKMLDYQESDTNMDCGCEPNFRARIREHRGQRSTKLRQDHESRLVLGCPWPWFWMEESKAPTLNVQHCTYSGHEVHPRVSVHSTGVSVLTAEPLHWR